MQQGQGSKNLVTGTISIRDTKFEIITVLHDHSSDKTVIEWKSDGNISNLSFSLNQLAETILRQIGIEPTSRSPTQISLEDLRGLAGAFSADGRLNRSSIHRMWANGARFPLLGALYIQLNTGSYSRTSNLELIDSVKAVFPNDSRIDAIAAMSIRTRFSPEFAEKKISALTRYVQKNPYQIQPHLSLAWTLAHANQTAKALSIYRMLLWRYPGHYRSWWGMSGGLYKHSWSIRGFLTWGSVSNRARELFPLLQVLNEEVIAKALDLNDDLSGIWVDKMRALIWFQP